MGQLKKFNEIKLFTVHLAYNMRNKSCSSCNENRAGKLSRIRYRVLRWQTGILHVV